MLTNCWLVTTGCSPTFRQRHQTPETVVDVAGHRIAKVSEGQLQTSDYLVAIAANRYASLRQVLASV